MHTQELSKIFQASNWNLCKVRDIIFLFFVNYFTVTATTKNKQKKTKQAQNCSNHLVPSYLSATIQSDKHVRWLSGGIQSALARHQKGEIYLLKGFLWTEQTNIWKKMYATHIELLEEKLPQVIWNYIC